MQVIKLVCKNCKMNLVFYVLVKKFDFMPIKRDYLRNGQLHSSTNWREAISLWYALLGPTYLTISNISHTEIIFLIFDTETSTYLLVVINKYDNITYNRSYTFQLFSTNGHDVIHLCARIEHH